MRKPINRLIIVLAAALIVSAAPAIAQSQPSQQHQNAQQPVNKEFDRQILEKFVAVTAELREIEHESAQRLLGVNDQVKAMKIEQEGALKKISAIEDQGLDLQTYNDIANQIHVDPKLRKEVKQIIKTSD